MNDGKICVSVCAETADELIEQIKRAEDLADVIEIRFDCWEKGFFNETFQKISKLKPAKPLLLTFRPKEEGGYRFIPEKVRGMFWESRNENVPDFGSFVDCEWEMLSRLTFSWRFYENIRNSQIVCSFHHFENKIKTFESLKRILDEMSKIRTRVERIDRRPARAIDIYKIAVQTEDITDTIAIWKLLGAAKQENKQIIPIAMGEAGKWTRILGLAHGAFMTYAALDAGKETASGQLTAQELIETYRVKELNKNTAIYGVVGSPVAHSISPEMHNAAFKFHNQNAVYIPFEVKNLGEFIKKFIRKETREIELNFKGFSVTIPLKQAIIEFLDELDETARAIGAVNTVKIENGRLLGCNTDANGFIEPLKTAYGDLSKAKVAILGAGGAARACIYALKKENAEVTIFARDLPKAEFLANEFQVEVKELATNNEQRTTNFNDFDVLVNATPLGTKGALENETPVSAGQIGNVKLVYDLIYNPLQTRLMKEADKANVPKIGGLAMLVAQGAAQQKIWTGKDAPVMEMSKAALKKLN